MPQKPRTRRRRLKKEGRSKMLGVYVSDETHAKMRLVAFQMEEAAPERGNVSLAELARLYIEAGLKKGVPHA